MVDGVLPEARAKVKITEVRSNHARADEVERLPMEDDADTDDTDTDTDDGADGGSETDEDDEDEQSDRERALDRERLGSRENFWGN
jgi:hypothetical protein